MTDRRAKAVQKIRAALVREGDVIQMQGDLAESGWRCVESITTSVSGKTIHFRAKGLSGYRVARVNTLIGAKRSTAVYLFDERK